MARIELREFIIGEDLNPIFKSLLTGAIGCNAAIHQYLVKVNDDGTKSELHGVAVDPIHNTFNPVAVMGGHVLKVAEYPKIPEHPKLAVNDFSGMYQ
jgi:hypothetical protein